LKTFSSQKTNYREKCTQKPDLLQGAIDMLKENQEGVYVDRRNFLKTTTMAGMAATLPETLLQNSERTVKPDNRGNKRKLLLLSGDPKAYENLVQSVKSIKEFEFNVISLQTNNQNPQEIIKVIKTEAPDLLFFGSLITGNTPVDLGYIDVPVILLPSTLDFICFEADAAAAFRANGTNAVLANSEEHAIELIKILAAPMLLQGRRAVIYSRPFNSSSVPARNLNAEAVYKRTGVHLEFRPLEELKPLLEQVNPEKARKEMERWKREAESIVEPTDKELLESCKMYVLLRSIIEEEGLSGISIDCLNFSFSPDPVLPVPCLAFARLRDEGFAVPCEADVCGMLTSMVLQEISQKPSYFANVAEVDIKKSSTLLRHCVSPLRLLGRNAAALPYNLRDYHGTGRGVTLEVSFPPGLEVTFGGFSKDLREFVMWPGEIQAGIHDINRLASKNMRRYCSSRAELKIREADVFLQKIVGIHHVLVAGSYTKELREEMTRLNVDIVGPLI